MMQNGRITPQPVFDDEVFGYEAPAMSVTAIRVRTR